MSANPTAIKRVSIRHEAIMDYLMCNPGMPLGNVAMHFGITQAWLSQIIHSDVFQEMLRKKQDIGFHHTVLPIKEKMLVVAHQALDRLVEELPLEKSASNLSSIAGDVLERLGYTSKAPAVQINNQQNNTVTVLQEEIAAARALYGRAAEPLPALEVSTDASIESDAPASEVSREGPARLGAPEPRSALSALLAAVRSGEEGAAVRAEGASGAAGEVP